MSFSSLLMEKDLMSNLDVGDVVMAEVVGGVIVEVLGVVLEEEEEISWSSLLM